MKTIFDGHRRVRERKLKKNKKTDQTKHETFINKKTDQLYTGKCTLTGYLSLPVKKFIVVI